MAPIIPFSLIFIAVMVEYKHHIIKVYPWWSLSSALCSYSARGSYALTSPFYGASSIQKQGKDQKRGVRERSLGSVFSFQ